MQIDDMIYDGHVADVKVIDDLDNWPGSRTWRNSDYHDTIDDALEHIVQMNTIAYESHPGIINESCTYIDTLCENMEAYVPITLSIPDDKNMIKIYISCKFSLGQMNGKWFIIYKSGKWTF